MKIAIIGRTEVLYDTAVRLRQAGHEIACILTAKEAPEYTKTAEDFRLLASEWGIPFARGSKIREHAGFLAEVQADIGVSINFTGIVPQSVVDLFPLGVLNAHGGDLPRYRGNACQAWAILNGERRIGLCIHRMIGGELDNGDIIARDYLPIDDRTTITAVLAWMANRIPDLMLDSVSRLVEDNAYVLELQSRNPAESLRCYPRMPEDGEVDWRLGARAVLRLVNASNRPYAGAFTALGRQRLTIWAAELVEGDEVFVAVPGQVTAIGEGFVEVACGADKIRLLEVEYDGVLASPDRFIRSIRTRLR